MNHIQPNVVRRRVLKIRVNTQVPFSRLNAGMAQALLDLLDGCAGLVGQLGKDAAQVVGREVGHRTVVLDELGIDKTHYLGHSLSGTLGWALAMHAPERFHSLIISADGPGSSVSEYAEVPREIGAEAWARGFEETARAHGVWTSEIYAAYASIDVDAVALASNELNQTDASAELGNIHTPTLLIAVPSDSDYPTVLSAAEQMPNAELYISELDHGGTGIRSDRLLPQITEFLAETSAE